MDWYLAFQLKFLKSINRSVDPKHYALACLTCTLVHTSVLASLDAGFQACDFVRKKQLCHYRVFPSLLP